MLSARRRLGIQARTRRAIAVVAGRVAETTTRREADEQRASRLIQEGNHVTTAIKRAATAQRTFWVPLAARHRIRFLDPIEAPDAFGAMTADTSKPRQPLEQLIHRYSSE